MLTKSLFALAAVCGLLAAVALPGMAGAQTEEKALTGLELKALIQNMGYETKDLNAEEGKEKVEFMVQKDGFDVWIAAEVSASKRFIWLTTFLGPTSKISNFAVRAPKLLEGNARIQPCQFYVTDRGNLNIALAIDNRNVTPAVLRLRMDKVAADVASSNDLWKP